MKERKELTNLNLEYEDIKEYLNKNTDLLEKYIKENVSPEMLDKWINEKLDHNIRNIGLADKSLYLNINGTEDPETDLIGGQLNTYL